MTTPILSHATIIAPIFQIHLTSPHGSCPYPPSHTVKLVRLCAAQDFVLLRRMDFDVKKAEAEFLEKYPEVTWWITSPEVRELDKEEKEAFERTWDTIHPLIRLAVKGDPVSEEKDVTSATHFTVKSYWSTHTSVFKYLTWSHRLRGELRGIRLYTRLEAFIGECIKEVVRDSKLKDEAQMLEFLERRTVQIHKSSWILRPLWYLNSYWVKRRQGEGLPIYTAYDLLHYLTSTLFIPEVGKHATIATFILTWKQPSLLPFSTPFVKSIMTSQLSAPELSALQKRTTKRPVYCFTRVLGQSESTGAKRPCCWFAGSHHWAVQIGVQEPPSTTHVQQTDHQVAQPGSTTRLVVLELERDGAHIGLRETNSVGVSDHQRFLGYTMYSHEEIKELGYAVIDSMRAKYHIVTNNCQRFCNGLADCILTPSTGQRILRRESELPVRFRTQIVYHRFWDYLLATEEDDMSPQSLPFSAQDLSSLVIDILSISTLIAHWDQREKIRFMMLIMTFWLCAWSADVGIFRHLLHQPAWMMTNEGAWRELERVAFPKRPERHCDLMIEL